MQLQDNLLRYFVKYDQVAKAVEEEKEKLFGNIEKNVEQAIAGMQPRDTLSFQLIRRGKTEYTVTASATSEYAGVLWSFLRKKDYGKYQIDSCITPVVLKEVEKTIIDFYSSKAVIQKIVETVSQCIQNSKIIHTAVHKGTQEGRQEIKDEITKQLANACLHEIKGEIVDEVTAKVIAFLNTSIMQQLMNIVGAYIATSAGKIMIAKMAVLISKSISLAAIKSVAMGVIKKIGVGVIAKTAIGKALIFLLALLGISGKAAFFVVLIPLIAGILVYQYKTFPRKLSKKVPPPLVSDLRSNFTEMNNSVVDGILENLSASLAK